MPPRQMLYALLALCGLAFPWFFNFQFMASDDGLNLLRFFALGFVNPAASSLTMDLCVAFSTYCVWVLVEARRVGMRHGWVFIALGLTVAFAFSFPLFLLLRERHLEQSAAGANA